MGGMACAIASNDGRLAGFINQRYDGFLSQKTPYFAIDVKVTPSHQQDGSSLDIHESSVEWRLDDYILKIWSQTFSAEFDFEAREGCIRQSLNLSPLDLLIKTVYTRYLLEQDSFFLHACGVVWKEKGYLFFGPSGSGKSTLADLAGGRVLADELVIVKKQSGPDKSPYSVYGMPFWRGVNEMAPLAGLFALHPSPTTFLTPLKPVEGLRRLLPSVGSYCLSPKQQAHLFGLAGLLVQQVPCYELHFSLDSDVWRSIDAHIS